MGACCPQQTEDANVAKQINVSKPLKETDNEQENKSNESVQNTTTDTTKTEEIKKQTDNENKDEKEYPEPPNGSSHSAKLQEWSHTFCWEEYERNMIKISVDRNIKMDNVRDGRLRMLMVVMKEFGHTDKVEEMVNKIHDAIYERLMGDKGTEIDIYNVGILLEGIACLQITKLEDEIPKILAKDIDFMNIWKLDGIGLRAYGTNNLMLYLNRNEKQRFRKMMERGMNTLQKIMKLPIDKPLWKRCASIIAGLARVMKQKDFDIMTQISANIMDELAKETVGKFKEFKDNADENLIKMNEGMSGFAKFNRQDHEDALTVPQIVVGRAKYKGEDWAAENFCCDGNPIIDLAKLKEFIAENDIDRKNWGFTHEAFGLTLDSLWEITEGDDQKELEDKLKDGELIIGRDVGQNYLGFLLALSHKIQPLFQTTMHDIYGEKHKEAPVKKMNRCQNKMRGKYANKPVPKAAELTDTVRCLVVFDDFADLLNGYKLLEENFAISRVKNGFMLEEKDVSFGYRDALINVIFDAGFCKIVCEVQFTTDLFYQLRSKLHRYYTFHRCEEVEEIVTPCNKYIDKLVTTIEQERKEKEEREQKGDQ